MAKRSRIETEQTVNQILDEALKQILTIGFQAMSYTTLSNATGISRTGISHHFPKKTEFLVRLDDRIGQFFIETLDFSSIESLELSWQEALQLVEHKAVLKLFFSLCGASDDNVTYFRAVNIAREIASTKLGENGVKCVNNLIGYSAILLLESPPQSKAA